MALVLLGVGVSGAMVLLFHSVRILHQADLVSRSAPQVLELAEAGPAGFDPNSPFPGAPVASISESPAWWMEWWWEDDGLVVQHHLTGGGASVERRIHISWAGGVRPIPLGAEAESNAPEPDSSEPDAPE